MFAFRERAITTTPAYQISHKRLPSPLEHVLASEKMVRKATKRESREYTVLDAHKGYMLGGLRSTFRQKMMLSVVLLSNERNAPRKEKS